MEGTLDRITAAYSNRAALLAEFPFLEVEDLQRPPHYAASVRRLPLLHE
jgi:hypothetical protein